MMNAKPRIESVCGPNGECCRPVVLRAYRGMRDAGLPESHALQAAVTVFLWHHPETPAAHAEAIVGDWVSGARH